jgi:glycine oxidase
VHLSGRAATGVELAGGECLTADEVVLAGGAWTRFFAPYAVDIPACPVRGQYLVLRPLPQPVRRVVYSPDVYLVPRADGTVYAGATEEHGAGFHKQVTAAGVRGLLDAAIACVPALARAELVSTGAGLRPGSPDRLPLLGRVPEMDGLVVATGHFRNGVLLSLITGRLLAEMLVHGRTSMDLEPFSPGRDTVHGGAGVLTAPLSVP